MTASYNCALMIHMDKSTGTLHPPPVIFCLTIMQELWLSIKEREISQISLPLPSYRPPEYQVSDTTVFIIKPDQP